MLNAIICPLWVDNCGSTTIQLFKIKYIQNASYSGYPAISCFLKTHFFDAFSCPQSEYEGSNFLLLCFLATGNQRHGINAFGEPRTLNITELTQAKNFFAGNEHADCMDMLRYFFIKPSQVPRGSATTSNN